MFLYDSNLKTYYSNLINDDHYLSGFGTKSLGDGRQYGVIENFLIRNKIPFKKVIIPDQIHSVNIEIINKDVDKIRIEDTDGLITQEGGIVLTAVTADCLPMVMVDKKIGLIGISHQGWRGSIKKMAQKMVEKALSLGSKIEDLKVALGPSVGQCCYDVDDDRYFQFKSEFDGYSEKIFHRQAGRWHLNLVLLNFLLLQEIGLKKEQIDYFPFCTTCDQKKFFSFRKYKKSKNYQYGEMLNFIVKIND